jgi:hypothetical protein
VTTSAARTGSTSLAAAALLLCGGVACGVNPAPPEASLETLDSLSARAKTGDGEALAMFTPAGAKLPFLSDPYVAGQTGLQDPDVPGMNVFPSFVEGRAAAYAVTEYWDGFPKVWLQPLYFLVTGFNPNTGGPLFVDGQPVFGGGTGSRFYSSYWQIYYVVAPAGSKTSDYSSEKAIFDGGFPLVKGAVTFCAVGPPGTNLAALASDTVTAPTTADPNAKARFWRHPLLPGQKFPARPAAWGWVEGEKVWFVDFGRNRYLVDDKLVVEADALFKFAIRDASGKATLLPLPSVGGTGPLYGWVPPKVVQGVPEFGSLWREYAVILNPANGGLPGANHPPAPFIPQAAVGLRAMVANAINATFSTGGTAYGALYTPVPDADVEAKWAADPALKEYTLRVAKNPFECFQQPNPAFPLGPCVWLDSQRAVEQNVGEALITETGRLSSCPLVYFNGAATP